MSNIDQQFVDFVVKSLVSNPDAVVIERRIDEKGVLLELTVDPEDLGRVIGKRGATAQSIRTLLRALGTKNNARYNLKIVDNGVGAGQRTDDNDDSDHADHTDQPVHVDHSGTTLQDDTHVQTPQSTDLAKQPNNDGIDEKNSSKSAYDATESDVIAKTRRELAAYDDLDV